jgi:hypothetical protein
MLVEMKVGYRDIEFPLNPGQIENLTPEVTHML